MTVQLLTYKKNYTEAFPLCQPAAEQGDARAQYNLGQMYFSGQGVPKDDAKAVEWYTQAAEQGNADAQNNLGGMYYDGTGVPEDKTKAVEWWQKAAEQGNADAQESLDAIKKR